MRYTAFLRGVMPTNAKMPEVKRAFEKAGFANVVTVLASGNVVFGARTASVRSLEKRAEAATAKHLGRAFMTFVRPVEELARIGARILRMEDGVVFSAYLPTPKGPVFMTLLQETFGKEQTTRTWQALEKAVSR